MKRALLLSLLSLLPFEAFGDDRGLAVAREADRRDLGWATSTAEMEMVLRNRHGQESVRRMRLRFLEVPEDGDKSFSYFQEPADIKGTSLLTFSHKVDNDDQWLYLPALKRVKRISSADKSGAFMGSEFAYEDIGSQEVEKYTYKLAGEDDATFTLERVPVSKYSGYTKQVVILDKAEHRIQKIDFYDRKDSLLKTLIYEDYKRYLDKYWRPDLMTMTNHQTGKTTLLRWKDYRFGVKLTAADFTQEALKRAR